MPTRIDADEVIRLAARDAPIVDVLPASIFHDEHLPGAVSVPLESFEPKHVACFRRDEPIVVYCFDQHCDLSARAASRLEAEGFTAVYDLIGGRATWTALGLPTEGAVADRGRISNYLQPAPSVGFEATIADLDALGPVRFPVAVVNDRGILAGALHETAARLPSDTPVARAMVPAPGTIRPELRIDAVAARLRKDRLDHVFVTTVSGALLGIVFTEDLHA